MPRLRSRAKILLEVDAEVVVDGRLAKLLMPIDDKNGGSNL